MQDVSVIAAAMVAVLVDALPELDAADLNSFYPAATERVALVGVPSGGASTLRPLTLQGEEWEAVHRVRLQLWVHLDTSDAATCMVTARDIGHRALVALAAHDGAGYELVMEGTPLQSEVGPDILSVGEVPHLLVTLTVQVWDAGAVD